MSIFTRSLLSPVCLVLLAITGSAFASHRALAQEAQEEVDDGDFSDGDAGAAPNDDSDPVPGLGMQAPTYAGTGCPDGTATATLAPDQKTLTVLFDQYIARAGGASGTARAQMNCQIQIPFQVPEGYRVQVVKLDYRGFASLPERTSSSFTAGFRYLDSQRRRTKTAHFQRRRVLRGPLQSNFELTSVLRGKQHWSPCGQSFVLAADSNLAVQAGPRSTDEAFSTVDSLDAVQMPVKFALRWKRCEAARPESSGPVPGSRRPIKK
jgi:hypothetical protein